MKIAFITVVPSPYQRDLFGAMAARKDLDLSVFYLEADSPDSPWPEKQLRPFEQILPGFWVPFAGARWHFNWQLPDFSGVDFVVLCTFTSWTGQWLMRRRLRKQPSMRSAPVLGRSRPPWLFWGERLREQPGGLKALAQRTLTTPLGGAAAIVGIGRLAEEDYRRRFPNNRHFCIPYHCDLSAFTARRPQRENNSPLTFIFCGQMIRRKGVDLLLAAFDKLVNNGADARLLLVGREAELPQFMTAVTPAARARIRYEGFQPPEKLPEYYAQADVFVLPSRHDGWGVVVNQALGAGLPIVCSDAVGAAHDLVEPEVNGLRFANGDSPGLFQCLERLAKAPATAAQWGDASRRKAADWSPQAGAEKWASVFKTLAQVERSRPV